MAIKAPGFGDNCKSVLSNLVILTGGTVFTDELNIKLKCATLDLLGSTRSITIAKDDTIILNGKGLKDSIQTHHEHIRAIIANPATSEYDNMNLQEQLVKLSGGIAVIKVGGSSKVEVGEKKDSIMMFSMLHVPLLRKASSLEVESPSLMLTTNSPGSTNLPINTDTKPVPTANFDQDLGVSIIC